jgi:hypothetical protein
VKRETGWTLAAEVMSLIRGEAAGALDPRPGSVAFEENEGDEQ